MVYAYSFSLKNSDLVLKNNSIYFSNNRNEFFSIDVKTGIINWKQKINSNLRPSLIGNYLFTISIEGYLIVIEKNSGNIIRITDIFKNFKKKKRDEIKPVGFIVGLKNIYLTTDNGRLLVIDIASGKTTSTLKIDNEKISRPFILDKNHLLIFFFVSLSKTLLIKQPFPSEIHITLLGYLILWKLYLA